MKDYKSDRLIDPREKVLVVKNKVYAKESYVAFDTSKLKDYPPKVYYDREDIYLGKMYDNDCYELPDIEDILEEYEDQCFSNHDLDDLRALLIRKREEFYKSLEEI